MNNHKKHYLSFDRPIYNQNLSQLKVHEHMILYKHVNHIYNEWHLNSL